ncbi:MAG: aldehyde dehydrogenase [Acidobacteria bacterium RIFCSPLOWO2_02_FULL_67_36]|nr:MAG: aldehyde dehydrogenase [Acidobacteria bacterium RIFCSPLOWO2_02_FULL_67_36]OFW19121.1 MAG: aldehyde dehydrogenase [Acidobacteria bacterium RIFCSPLOWO2_12_FULL_66_21]
MRTLKNFIGGEWRESAGGKVQDLNPADTSEVIAEAPSSTSKEAAEACEAAAKAFEGWRNTPAPVRGQILYKVQRRMEERRQELAEALTREEGKTIAESRGEVQRAINVIEFFAGEARRITGETIPSELPHNFCYTVKQPVGPVGIITPWNFPVAIPVWKMAPALVSGNTVVFKPATLTPLTAALIVEMFDECGLPPGVLNLVYGGGREVGDTIVRHPAIQAVSFTGSNDVGVGLYGAAAARGIKCQCEMGGKNPIVILGDADLALAVESTIQGAFGSTGQRCTATSRAVVVDSIADEFLDRLQARTSSLVVGNGMDPATSLGPSVDERQLETVLSYISVGRNEGARVVAGGARMKDGRHERGFFVAPTIFDGVDPSMRIAQEEIFGPVLSLIRVKDAETALATANGVRFGLSASIYTSDVASMFRFVDRLEAGIVHVNSPTVGGEAHIPFGGMKATGVGLREMGRVAIDFYTELKVVYVDYTGGKRAGNLY